MNHAVWLAQCNALKNQFLFVMLVWRFGARHKRDAKRRSIDECGCLFIKKSACKSADKIRSSPLRCLPKVGLAIGLPSFGRARICIRLANMDHVNSTPLERAFWSSPRERASLQGPRWLSFWFAKSHEWYANPTHKMVNVRVTGSALN